MTMSSLPAKQSHATVGTNSTYLYSLDALLQILLYVRCVKSHEILEGFKSFRHNIVLRLNPVPAQFSVGVKSLVFCSSH